MTALPSQSSSCNVTNLAIHQFDSPYDLLPFELAHSCTRTHLGAQGRRRAGLVVVPCRPSSWRAIVRGSRGLLYDLAELFVRKVTYPLQIEALPGVFAPASEASVRGQKKKVGGALDKAFRSESQPVPAADVMGIVMKREYYCSQLGLQIHRTISHLSPLNPLDPPLSTLRNLTQQNDRHSDLTHPIESVPFSSNDQNKRPKLTSSLYLRLRGAGILSSTLTCSLFAPPSAFRIKCVPKFPSSNT